MENLFINKAKTSGIIAIDLLDYKPLTEIATFDIKDLLFLGMIVKEKPFRESVSALDFTEYKEKTVAVTCSADAIIPSWAYMLLAEKLHPHAAHIDFSGPETMRLDLWKQNLQNADWKQYKDQKVVVKARSEITPALYLLASFLLKPWVKSLMYGEIGMPKVIYKK
ncbi:DUF2480 family protein [Chryseobacterium sp. JUb7]|uniref:DUF2480 family protein n=1 Tax=Chryseobacterium sp. JUb7 TaxID=2940599 RepID=UPI00216983C9|nr:DUF2480 family protein [Chryseobacterium sp. JUb7]MCS3532938.1 hypothetical protein [Chryseobacterium sp. JUb7]